MILVTLAFGTTASSCSQSRRHCYERQDINAIMSQDLRNISSPSTLLRGVLQANAPLCLGAEQQIRQPNAAHVSELVNRLHSEHHAALLKEDSSEDTCT
jgi:hypothetical protein